MIDKDKFLEWLANEIKSVVGDGNAELGERFAYRKVGTAILDGKFDISDEAEKG